MGRSKIDVEQLDHNVLDHADTDTPYAGGPTSYDGLYRDVGGQWAVRRNTVTTSNPTVNDDSSIGYVIGSHWINTANDFAFVCVDASVGAAVWSQTSQGAGQNTIYYSQSLGDNSQPFLQTNQTGWTVLQGFSFDGTATVGTPNHFEILASRTDEGPGQSSDVRLWDSTNGNQIALINYTALARTIYSTPTLTNLPAGSAQFEIQARKTLVGRTQLWFAELARI